MKPSELSIGDWVCAAGPVINGEERLTPPMRVVSVGETWACLRIDPEQGDPFEHDIDEIRPIPLTSEILLANGWNIFKEDRFRLEMRDAYAYGRLGASVDVEFRNDGMIFAFVGIWTYSVDMRLPVFYVHELQHVLRLAGIGKEIEL